jgi:hypothetical protein
MTPLPGCTPTKPGSACFPFFGVVAVILDEAGKVWYLMQVHKYFLIPSSLTIINKNESLICNENTHAKNNKLS